MSEQLDCVSSVQERALAMAAASEPVAAVVRSGVPESLHRGVIALVDSTGQIAGSLGNAECPLLLRSAAKPFQALAVVESGAAAALSLSQEELAVMCGSHGGGPQPVLVVKGLLARLGVPETSLVCGAAEHTCSGKHAGMIALALQLGAPLSGYEQPTHPVQREIERTVKSLLALRSDREEASGSLLFGVDGCGVPMLRMSVGAAAYLYALLAEGAMEGLRQIREAMLAFPHLLAGEGRLDTVVVQAGGGRVVAKAGAEGMQAFGLLRDPRGGESRSSCGGTESSAGECGAIGGIIKIEDGSGRAVPVVLRSCLEACGLFLPSDVYARSRVFPRRAEDRGRGDAGHPEIVSLVQPSCLRGLVLPLTGGEAEASLGSRKESNGTSGALTRAEAFELSAGSGYERDLRTGEKA